MPQYFSTDQFTARSMLNLPLQFSVLCISVLM